jgi:hypothetical protein
MDISTIEPKNDAWGASLPRVRLEPGSSHGARRAPSLTSPPAGAIRGAEKLPQKRARNANMNEPNITCPNSKTEIRLSAQLKRIDELVS